LKKVHSLTEFSTRCAHVVPPNYHGSLDAIVPVVRAMPVTCENGDRRHKDQVSVAIELGLICFPYPACLAAPAQWCEAYLKAEGMWK
jgi:hypothetical protein